MRTARIVVSSPSRIVGAGFSRILSTASRVWAFCSFFALSRIIFQAVCTTSLSRATSIGLIERTSPIERAVLGAAAACAIGAVPKSVKVPSAAAVVRKLRRLREFIQKSPVVCLCGWTGGIVPKPCDNPISRR